MKTKIILLPILCGLLSATGTFAKNNEIHGDNGSRSPGTTPHQNAKPHRVNPDLDNPNFADTNSTGADVIHTNSTHSTKPFNGYNGGDITNRSGSMTNGGRVSTNGWGAGSMTNRMENGGSTNNFYGHGRVNTNNGTMNNRHNPGINYTNTNPHATNMIPHATNMIPHATNMIPNATNRYPYGTNRNPYAVDPRVMERGGSVTNK